jgi:hypothetical protein
MPIAYGTVVNCTISPVGDVDTFRFSAVAGETVMIHGVIGATGGVRPCVELIAPDNSRLRACENAFTNRIDAALTQDGTYAILLSDRSSFFTGAYTLALERVRPPSPGARPIGYAQSLEDRIDLRGDVDVFVFNASQGDVVVISVSIGVSSGVRPCAELATPNGARTVACENAFRNRIEATLTSDGAHALLVRDRSNAFTGAYTVTLQCVLGPCTAGPSPSPPTPAGVPGVPGNLAATVTGPTVMVSWSAPATGGAPTSYVVAAGSAPGASNVVVLDTGNSATQLTAVGVPAGTYYVRLRARNALGVGPLTPEISVPVGLGTCASRPSAPGGLAATVAGRLVTLTWAAGVGTITTYVIDVGSFAGVSNITTLETGNQRTILVATAPLGTYYVRIRARNACGTSGPSNEVIAVVH